MPNVLTRMRDLGAKVNTSSMRSRSEAMEKARERHELNELIARHSVAHAELARILGLNRHTLKRIVQEAIDANIIDDVMLDSNRYRYTLSHIHTLMDYLNRDSWSDKFRETVVMCVGNLKGGTGKTSTALHIGAGLALDLNLRPNVLIIDFDPQGTLSRYVMTEDDNVANTVTAVDLALEEFDGEDSICAIMKQDGYTRDEIFQEALYESHIPNLHVMPALPLDSRFDEIYYGQETQAMREKVMAALRDNVIETLKPHYDVIIIDTGPHNAPMTWAAAEASNALLTPVSPRALDWCATGLYCNTLPKFIEAECNSGGENLKWWKVVCVNAEREHNRDIPMVLEIRQKAGSDGLPSYISRSPAFEEAAKNFVTVFDLQKSKAESSSRKIDEAVSTVKNVAEDITLSLIADFGE